MKHSKINETQQKKEADTIRKTEIARMEEQEPCEEAKRRMRRKPYQAAELVKEQGQQMKAESVGEYCARLQREKRGK